MAVPMPDEASADDVPDRRTTVLYRFFDSAGVLLYVGISRRMVVRVGDHRRHAPWWEEATSCTLERFRVPWEAAQAELAAIAAEHPVYNRVGRRQADYFGVRIRQLRKATGLSQDGLAREVGVSLSAVVQIERGTNRPSRKTTDGLARVLGVEATQLEGWLREGRTDG